MSRSPLPRQVQEARVRSRRERLLGDSILGQLVVEVRRFHFLPNTRSNKVSTIETRIDVVMGT